MSENLNDLEMAKKRDYKIMITDAAINKVPRVQYKEIPETEYDNLRELARQVLQISKDENDSNEVAVTYSLESAQLIEKGERYLGIALGAEHDVDPLSDSTFLRHRSKNRGILSAAGQSSFQKAAVALG